MGHIPVVLISSTLRGHVNQLEGVRWSNADGFILEPVEGEMLASTLRSVLQTSERSLRAPVFTAIPAHPGTGAPGGLPVSRSVY